MRDANSHADEPREEDATSKEDRRDAQFATTLARGLDILRCFTPEDVSLGNSQLAARTGLSRPTVSRFTYTLTRLGYLRSDAAGGKYTLGPAVLSLGYPMLAGIALRQPCLELSPVAECDHLSSIRFRRWGHELNTNHASRQTGHQRRA